MNVRAVVREVLEANVDDVPADDATPFVIPSIALVQVLEALETKLELRFAAKDLAQAQLDSVERLARFVVQRLA